MKIVRIILILIFGCFAVQSTIAQKVEEWIRIESPSRDISFAVPANGHTVFEDNGNFNVWYTESGVYLSVSMRRDGDAKSSIKHWWPGMGEKKDFKFYKTDDFFIREYKRPDESSGVDFQWIEIASSHGFYSFGAQLKRDSANIYEKFLMSIRLNDRPLFVGEPSAIAETNTVRTNDLKTDDVVLNALKRPDAKGIKLGRGVLTEEKLTPDKTIYSKELIVLRKPHPAYTDSARMKNVQGSLKLRVTFLANGQVGPIALVKALDKGLEDNAVEAAEKIKFLPAEINGKPVDVVRYLEYQFSIY